MGQRVKVSGAPGYADFEGTVVPGLHRYSVGEGCPVVSVIVPDPGDGFEPEPHVIPSQYVTDIEDSL